MLRQGCSRHPQKRSRAYSLMEEVLPPFVEEKNPTHITNPIIHSPQSIPLSLSLSFNHNWFIIFYSNLVRAVRQ
ncbi:hypothetical protein LWI29_038241 [Acer saccharum]|uniref:Uncharacterized protein n=1 Tax=Acer saccharum TaxID=4024 RepID=A0AA39SF25_ACESA|nr:hypothetical protein LWI29_038241 [Acer saccharum]